MPAIFAHVSKGGKQGKKDGLLDRLRHAHEAPPLIPRAENRLAELQDRHEGHLLPAGR